MDNPDVNLSLYSDELNKLSSEFKDWSKDDLFLALQESRFDFEKTRHRLLNGNFSKWDEVKPNPSNTKQRNRKNDLDSKHNIKESQRPTNKEKSHSERDYYEKAKNLNKKDQPLDTKHKTNTKKSLKQIPAGNSRPIRQNSSPTAEQIENKVETQVKNINAKIMELNNLNPIVSKIEQDTNNSAAYYSKRSDAMSSASILVEPPTPNKSVEDQHTIGYSSSSDIEDMEYIDETKSNLQKKPSSTELNNEKVKASEKLRAMIDEFVPNEYCLTTIPKLLQSLEITDPPYSEGSASADHTGEKFFRQFKSGQFGNTMHPCVGDSQNIFEKAVKQNITSGVNSGSLVDSSQRKSNRKENGKKPEQYYDPYGQPIFN